MSTSVRSASYRRFRRWLIALVALLLTGIACAWTLNRVGVAIGLLEISFDESLGKRVVQAITAKTLIPGANGIVKLPPQLAKVSAYGEVTVTSDPTGGSIILFRTWVGKGCNLRGLVHRSAPASGPPPATIGALVPNPYGTPQTTSLIELNVDAQINANWYHVYWDLD